MDLSFEALIDSFVNKYKTPIKRAARQPLGGAVPPLRTGMEGLSELSPSLQFRLQNIFGPLHGLLERASLRGNYLKQSINALNLSSHSICMYM